MRKEVSILDIKKEMSKRKQKIDLRVKCIEITNKRGEDKCLPTERPQCSGSETALYMTKAVLGAVRYLEGTENYKRLCAQCPAQNRVPADTPEMLAAFLCCCLGWQG